MIWYGKVNLSFIHPFISFFLYIMMTSRDELKQEIIKYYNLGWNIIPTTITRRKLKDGRIEETKTPVLRELKPYFDANNRIPLEELLKHADTHTNPCFALVNGKQPNNRYYISLDIDTRDEQVRKLVLTNIPLSLYQETRKGFHIFLEIEGDHSKIRDMLENKVAEGILNGNKVRIEFRVKDCLTFFAGEGYSKLQGEMVSLTLEEIHNAVRATLDAFNLILILQDHYYSGNRNDTIYRLSGITAKKRIPKTVALMMVDALCTFYRDEQKAGRLQVVKNSYKAYENGEPLNTKLEEIIPKDVAKKIYEYFDYRPTANGNNNNSKDNNSDNNSNTRKRPKEFLITPTYKEAYMMLDIAYKHAKGSPYIQALYMLGFFRDDDEDTRFLADYRYVYDKDNPEQGYWIEWNGYSWTDADIKVLKLKIDRFFTNKIRIVNNVYNEILEVIKSNDNVDNNNDNNDDNNNDDAKNNDNDDNDADNNNNNNNDDNDKIELINKHREVIDRLNRLLIHVKDNKVKTDMLVKWLEAEKEKVISLLMYAIRSERSTNEMLQTITQMSEYHKEGFLITKEMLDPERIVINNNNNDNDNSNNNNNNNNVDNSSYDQYNGLYINTRTHLLIWDTGKKEFIAAPHGDKTKKYYITKYVDIEYRPEAKCIKFVNFLKEISLGNVELAKFLALIGGLTLTSRLEEIAFIFSGGGYNGKSTLVQIYLDIIGKNSHEGKEEELNEIQNDLTPHLYNWIGKTLIAIDDPRIKVINLQNLKTLVSTGNISVRTLYHRPIEIKKDFNIIICINGEPKFTENTEGMYRRVCIVGFDYKIPKEKAILDYHKLILKEEKHGIFNLFLSALKEYLSNINRKKIMDYAPDIVKARTERSIWEQDHAREFYDRFLVYVPNPEKTIPMSKIHEKYLEFCDMKKLPTEFRLSKQELSRILAQYSMVSRLINKVTHKICVEWKEPPRIDDLIVDEDNVNNNNNNNNNNNTNNNNTNNTNNNNNIYDNNNNNNSNNNTKTNANISTCMNTDSGTDNNINFVNNVSNSSNNNGNDSSKNNNNDNEPVFRYFKIEECKTNVSGYIVYKCPISTCPHCFGKKQNLIRHLVEDHEISLDQIVAG